jgi:hypothetical protein
MTEWWLIIAFFWAWLLADCVKISRRARFGLSAGWGFRRSRIHRGHALPSWPLPISWQAVTEDCPYSFSPDGICNVPVGSAARGESDHAPATAWPWEDIAEITQKRGRLFINGRDFCAATIFADANQLRALVSHCCALTPDARAAFLRSEIAEQFRPTHLKRQTKIFLSRTRDIAMLGLFNFCLAALATVYLLIDGPALVGDNWAARIAAALPLLGGYFAVVHVATIIFAWKAHRRLLPKKSEERVRLVLNAFMLPPHALRLRAQMAASWFPPQHVLSWLVAVGRSNDLARLARATLADIWWPVMPPNTPADSPVHLIATWMRGEIRPHLERLAVQAGLNLDALLRAPEPDGPASCLYCPRCLDQFTRADARCPRGVKLLALK